MTAIAMCNNKGGASARKVIILKMFGWESWVPSGIFYIDYDDNI